MIPNKRIKSSVLKNICDYKLTDVVCTKNSTIVFSATNDFRKVY